MGHRYIPSNKFNPGLTFLFFLLGLAASFIITGLAALIGLWLIRPYGGIVFVFISAWAVYWIQKKCIKLSKNRNIKFARTLLVIASLLISFYHMSSVAATTFVLGDRLQNLELALTLKDFTNIFIGGLVYFMTPMAVIKSFLTTQFSWIIYFVVILASNIFIPQFAAEQANKPFSEDANKWMVPVPSAGRFEPFPDREQHMVVSAMKREDITPFIERPRCTAQDPVDYAQLIFLKVDQAHSGYVGVQHFHQQRSGSGQLIPNKYQMIEFIPPIQVGVGMSHQLESAINSSAVTGYVDYPYHNSNRRRGEEYGYKMYRTASEVADYDHAMGDDSPPPTDNRGYRNDRDGRDRAPLASSFQYVPTDYPRDNSPYNPALRPGYRGEEAEPKKDNDYY